MNNPKLIVIIASLLIVVGGGGFYAGMKYQQNQRRGQSGQMRQRTGQNFRPVVGDIISQDDKSITVKLEDGSSKIVLFSDNTSINKASEGSKDDLKVDEKVGVFGTENSDGSVTAQNIQLNPTARGMFGQHPQ